MTVTFSNPITDAANHAALYDQDYVLWLDQAVDLLRLQNFAEINIENLIEELAEMGGSQKQAIESNLEVLLMHLLKYKYQP